MPFPLLLSISHGISTRYPLLASFYLFSSLYLSRCYYRCRLILQYEQPSRARHLYFKGCLFFRRTFSYQCRLNLQCEQPYRARHLYFKGCLFFRRTLFMGCLFFRWTFSPFFKWTLSLSFYHIFQQLFHMQGYWRWRLGWWYLYQECFRGELIGEELVLARVRRLFHCIQCFLRRWCLGPQVHQWTSSHLLKVRRLCDVSGCFCVFENSWIFEQISRWVWGLYEDQVYLLCLLKKCGFSCS